jgi:hypothetical protein
VRFSCAACNFFFSFFFLSIHYFFALMCCPSAWVRYSKFWKWNNKGRKANLNSERKKETQAVNFLLNVRKSFVFTTNKKIFQFCFEII